MGILSRFSDIMEANINGVLSKMEQKNADKLLEKYLQDAQENLGKVKAETAAIMAEEVAAKRTLETAQADVTKYTNYAMQAVQAGNDEDAKKFLSYKSEKAAECDRLSQAYLLAKGNSEKMKQMTQKLMGDIQTSGAKLSELKLKLNMAKQQENMNKLNEKMSGNSLGNFDSLADSIQKRIDTADAAASLNHELNYDEKADLESKYANAGAVNSPSVDDELAALKASMGK